jgi:hypothetical protein
MRQAHARGVASCQELTELNHLQDCVRRLTERSLTERHLWLLDQLEARKMHRSPSACKRRSCKQRYSRGYRSESEKSPTSSQTSPTTGTQVIDDCATMACHLQKLRNPRQLNMEVESPKQTLGSLSSLDLSSRLLTSFLVADIQVASQPATSCRHDTVFATKPLV